MRHLAAPALVVAALFGCATCLAACGGEDSTTGLEAASPPREVVSPQSASFEKYSGDGPGQLGIAEFGVEGSESERNRVQGVVVPYLQAVGAGDWWRACGYLSDNLVAQFEEIAAKSKRPTKPTCAEILRALVSSSTRRSGEPLVRAPGGIASLRIKDPPGGGFALFHGSDGEDHWMTVRREGDIWGVMSPTPEAFLAPVP
jgi:hypothetical protein